MATAVNERVAFGFMATKGDASRVNTSGNQYGPRALIVPITDRDLHFASAADRDADWNVANPTHPTLYIHSETTPPTDYTALSHDGDFGYVNVAGGNMALQTAGTTRLTISSTALTVPDNEILALGADGDIALVLRSTILATNTALTSVMIGTPVTPAVAANSLILSNITASGDVLVAANLGGNSQAWLWVDSSASLMTLYGAGVSAIEVGTNIVVNEGAADRDLRVEGDNNANMVVIDAGTDSMSLGRAVIAGTYLAVDGSAVNRAGVTAVARHLHIPSVTITQTNADPTSLALGAASYVGQPTFAGANPNQTIVDAASFIVAAAPAAGTNMTLTRSWAAILGGRVGIGLDPTAITHDINNTTLVVFNAQAADIDFQVEGDNTDTMLVIDAGTDSASMGSAVTAGAFLTIGGAAVNRAGVTNVGRALHMPAATFTQTNADPTTLAVGARVVIGVPTFGGSNLNQTITDAASLYIVGIPVAGANMTLTRSVSVLLGREVDHTIRVESTTTAATVGGALTLRAGISGTSGVGGALTVSSGSGDTTGAGGLATYTSGAGGGTSGASGGITIQPGTVTSGAGGALQILGRAGVASNNVGSTITITAGTSVGTGVGGAINITAGGAANGSAGNVLIAGGPSSVTGQGSGTATVRGGDGTDGQGGSLILRGGEGAGGNNAGPVTLRGGDGGGATSGGGSLTIRGGAGVTTGTGGAVTITGGAGGNVTAGAAVTLTGGAAGGGNTNGGNIRFAGGALAGTGITGTVAVNNGIFYDYRTITSEGTDGDVVYTAAQIRTGVITKTTTGAPRNDSMPTAANLVAGLPGAYVGQSFFFVLNNNGANTLAMTTAAAGIVYDGNTTALAAGAARLYLVVITNVTGASEAATVFGL